MANVNQVHHFKNYHLFVILAVMNLIAYYLFVGHSTISLTSDRKDLNAGLFSYFLSISIMILLVWLSYIVFKKRLVSKNIIWVHLFTVMSITFFTPWIILKVYNPFPRRYLEFNGNGGLSKFFGSMTWAFVIVSCFLIASETFLLMNIRKKIQ